MKLRTLFLSAAAALVGIGSHTAQPAPVASTSKTAQPTDSTSHTPKQSQAPATKAQQMALRVGSGEPKVVRRFIGRSGPRRVKYGRGSKWVMLS